jgi:hypothetical protein
MQWATAPVNFLYPPALASDQADRGRSHPRETMPELVACPSCGCRVQVTEMLLGQRTRCIACSAVFVASPEPSPPAPVTIGLAPTPAVSAGRPVGEAKGLAHYRQPLCPQCHRPVSWEAPNCPHCGHLFDMRDAVGRGDWISRRDSARHRGNLIDTLGTLSMIGGILGPCTGPIGVSVALATGIPALVMAGHDLEQMRVGAVDVRGRSTTEWGRNKAIVGIMLGVLVGLVCLLWVFENVR